MLAIDEVYWTVNEDRTRLTVSTEPPFEPTIEETKQRFELLFPEPKNYRLPFALGLLALANVGDVITTIKGINLGADEVNPVANAIFGLVGVTTGVILIKLLLMIIVSVGAYKMWDDEKAKLNILSIIYFAIGVYSMVTVANYYTLSGL